MKRFSRSTVFALVLAMIFSLSSCRVKLNREVDINDDANITSIDIYTYTADFEANATELRELSTPVYSVTEDRIQDFADVLEDLEYKEVVWFPFHMDYAYVFSNGYVVVVEYDNGGYDLVAGHGIFIHGVNENGIYHNYTPADYCGDIPWNQLIESYMHE